MFKRDPKKEKKKEKPKVLYAPCTEKCRNRYRGVCLRLPMISMVADRFFYLTDSRDVNSGRYIERNGEPIDPKYTLKTYLPQHCPFTKPRRIPRNEHKDPKGNYNGSTPPTIDSKTDDFEDQLFG